jgi:hypothetical protein
MITVPVPAANVSVPPLGLGVVSIIVLSEESANNVPTTPCNPPVHPGIAGDGRRSMPISETIGAATGDNVT